MTHPEVQADLGQREKIDFDFLRLAWGDIEWYCLNIARKMDKNGYRPQAIIGLLRGGVVPARIFSDYFDILLDFYALDVKLYDGIGSTMSEPQIKPFDGDIAGKEILIVDDIWDSGRTMEAVLSSLKGESVTTATVCWKLTSEGKPDYHGMLVGHDDWIVFPWESREFEREMNEQEA